MTSIFNDVFKLVEAEKTKIGQRAFNTLNDGAGKIANIVEKNGVFWFEYYSMGNSCSKAVYDYLKRFIQRKMGFKYLYDATAKETR